MSTLRLSLDCWGRKDYVIKVSFSKAFIEVAVNLILI